jgi:glycopeptide antibiotics resistance protein
LMLEFFPFPLLVGLGILIIILFLLWRKRSPAYLFCFSVFWLYLLFVVSLTIFPMPLPETIVARTPVIYILSRVNLVPFNFGGLFDNHPNVIFQEIFGNILLTIPFGFGIPFLACLKPKNLPWLAIGAGLVIETTQLGFSLLIGGLYRSVDINDVLLNATGVLLGYALFRGFACLYVAISYRINIKQNGLFAYLYEVALCGRAVHVVSSKSQ